MWIFFLPIFTNTFFIFCRKSKQHKKKHLQRMKINLYMRVEMRGRYEVRGYKLRLALLLLFKIFRFLSIIKLTWRIWNAGKTNRLFQIQRRNLLRIRGQLTRSHHRSRVLFRFLLYFRSPFFSILLTQVYTNGFGHGVRKLQVLNSN